MLFCAQGLFQKYKFNSFPEPILPSYERRWFGGFEAYLGHGGNIQIFKEYNSQIGPPTLCFLFRWWSVGEGEGLSCSVHSSSHSGGKQKSDRQIYYSVIHIADGMHNKAGHLLKTEECRWCSGPQDYCCGPAPNLERFDCSIACVSFSNQILFSPESRIYAALNFWGTKQKCKTPPKTSHLSSIISSVQSGQRWRNPGKPPSTFPPDSDVNTGILGGRDRLVVDGTKSVSVCEHTPKMNRNVSVLRMFMPELMAHNQINVRVVHKQNISKKPFLWKQFWPCVARNIIY